jgi:hypothetical protein
MKIKLLAGACAAAVCTLWFGQAAADPTATLGGGYSYTDVNGSSGHLNDWGVNGSVAAPVLSNWTVQADGSYDDLTGEGSGSAHTAQISGTAFWSGAKGRIGATAGYNELGSGHSTAHLENYGGFGVLYPTNSLTLGFKGGALVGDGLHTGYVGAEIVGYITPDAAISGTIDNTTIGNTRLTAYGVHAEYLASHTLPISVSGGFTRTELGPVELNTYTIGLKYYFGGKGSLVEHQRSGDETWGAKQSATSFLF